MLPVGSAAINMDDLMNKLQNVLNDEESMKQIKELADMLAGEMGGQQEDSPNGGGGAAQTVPIQQNNAPPPDFAKLLQGLGGMMNTQGGQSTAAQGTSSSGTNSPFGGLDVSKLMKFQSVMQSASKPDKNIDLLMALRPLLKEENQVKIDRLVKIFRLFSVYPALKESGLLGGDLLGLF